MYGSWEVKEELSQQRRSDKNRPRRFAGALSVNKIFPGPGLRISIFLSFFFQQTET